MYFWSSAFYIESFPSFFQASKSYSQIRILNFSTFYRVSTSTSTCRWSTPSTSPTTCGPFRRLKNHRRSRSKSPKCSFWRIEQRWWCDQRPEKSHRGHANSQKSQPTRRKHCTGRCHQIRITQTGGSQARCGPTCQATKIGIGGQEMGSWVLQRESQFGGWRDWNQPVDLCIPMWKFYFESWRQSQ